MIRQGFLISTLLVLTTCTNTPSTRYTELVAREVPDLGISITLPASFIERSIEEEYIQLESSNEPEERIVARLKYLDRILANEEAGFPSRYFLDSLQEQNDLRISLSRVHFSINKYMSSELFLYIDQLLQEQAKELNMKFEPIENTFFTLANGSQVMKVRYRSSSLSINSASIVSTSSSPPTRYTTSYFLNTDLGSFFILCNHESEDFEYFVRTIRDIKHMEPVL